MNFIEDLRWRGMLQDIMPGTEELFAKGPVTGYIGFDPTADSLHIGSLVQILLLVRLQQAGHKPIALVGGATGMVGDPSGKSEERNLLSSEDLEKNVQGIQKQLERYLDFSHPVNPAKLVNNYDWYKNFNLLDFLRQVGKHLTVNYMMAKDSVTRRLETGLSYTEFSYQLIQGYDFYYLHDQHGCQVQMGGSDQWGNITAGTELIRRMGGGEAFAFTIPLVTKADGSKFGKSEAGTNIWLDLNRTSSYEFYQFWMNVGDAEAEKYLKLFTFRTQEDIAHLVLTHSEDPGRRIMQQALALDITQWVHGEEALQSAQLATDFLFGKGGFENRSLNEPWFAEVCRVVPGATLSRADLDAGAELSTLLTDSGAVPSKSEFRRLIQGGGLKMNFAKVENAEVQIHCSDLLEDTFLIIQKGKKNYFVIRFE
jgi:tyrosyl-tRNA synthetase